MFDPQVIYRTKHTTSNKWLAHVELGWRVHDALRDENSRQGQAHVRHLAKNARFKAEAR